MNLAVLAILADPVVSLSGWQLGLAILTILLGGGGLTAFAGPYLAARAAKAQAKSTVTAAELEAEDRTQARLWEEVEKLRTRIDARDKKIEELIESNSTLSSRQGELQGQVDKLKLQLQEKDIQIEEKDDRIAALESEITSLREDLGVLQRAQGAFQSTTEGHFNDIHDASAPKDGGRE